jgi:hypothetical protein
MAERTVEASASLRAQVQRVCQVLDNVPARVLAPGHPAGSTDRVFTTTVTVKLRRGAHAGQDVEIEIGHRDESGDGDEARWPMSWTPAGKTRLLPRLQGTLVARRDAGHTELHMTGDYTPPLGAAGAFGDGVLGHHVARSTIAAFLEGLASRLDGAIDGDTDSLLGGATPAGEQSLNESWLG